MAEHITVTGDAEQDLLDADISDAEMAHRPALLGRIERSRDAMIARRGGKPIDVAVVDALLAEMRGGDVTLLPNR